MNTNQNINNRNKIIMPKINHQEFLIKPRKINLPNNDEKYLILNNKKYNKISGPISFHILEPKNNMSKYKLPLIILFGDEHFSDEYLCDNNKNTLDMMNNFLTEIDGLSNNNNYKTDIFIEGGLNLKDKYENDIIKNNKLIPNLREKIRICYYEKTRDKCQYKNIRFHLADARFLETNINNIVIKPNIINYNDFIDLLKNIIKNKKNKYIISLYLSLNNFIKNKYIYDLYFEIIMSIINNNFNNNKIIKLYVDIINNNYILKKQYNKNNPNIVNNMILKLINNNINDIKDSYNYNHSLKNFKELIYFLYNYDMYNYHNYNNFYISINKLDDIAIDNNLKLINNIMTNINTIFLDIYYLLRSFKNINDKTLISICIFGNYHIKNIIKCLTDLEYYNIIYSKTNNNIDTDNFRCVVIDRNINLDNIIFKHINKYFYYKYKKYYIKLFDNQEIKYDNKIKYYNEYIRSKYIYYLEIK